MLVHSFNNKSHSVSNCRSDLISSSLVKQPKSEIHPSVSISVAVFTTEKYLCYYGLIISNCYATALPQYYVFTILWNIPDRSRIFHIASKTWQLWLTMCIGLVQSKPILSQWFLQVQLLLIWTEVSINLNLFVGFMIYAISCLLSRSLCFIKIEKWTRNEFTSCQLNWTHFLSTFRFLRNINRVIADNWWHISWNRPTTSDWCSILTK